MKEADSQPHRKRQDAGNERSPGGVSLQRTRMMERIASDYGCEAEYLWLKYPNCAVFRHPASKKWFALVMDVQAGKLGLPSSETVDVLTLKCDPLMRDSLLTQPGFFPAYHMNKSQWITVLLDGPVKDAKILPLVELSYAAVAPKTRKARSE